MSSPIAQTSFAGHDSQHHSPKAILVQLGNWSACGTTFLGLCLVSLCVFLLERLRRPVPLSMQYALVGLIGVPILVPLGSQALLPEPESVLEFCDKKAAGWALATLMIYITVKHCNASRTEVGMPPWRDFWRLCRIEFPKAISTSFPPTNSTTTATMTSNPSPSITSTHSPSATSNPGKSITTLNTPHPPSAAARDNNGVDPIPSTGHLLSPTADAPPGHPTPRRWSTANDLLRSPKLRAVDASRRWSGAMLEATGRREVGA